MEEHSTYKGAGVNIDVANEFVEKIKPFIKAAGRREVMGKLGGFGGLFHLDLARIKDPVLVSSTDGVGTKLKIAQMMNRHDTVGIDLVAMSVNDVLVQGAEPLFFLDYIATGRLEQEKMVQLVEGISRGCQNAGCALIGGETAEMPSFYPDGVYDLAGFCVGIVDADKLLEGSEIRVGDRIIGITSSGLHSNGYSLARKVLLDQAGLRLDQVLPELDHDLGTELLMPTKIYVRSVMNLIKNFTIKGIVHITGGGFMDNIPRIVPSPCQAVITRGSWTIPPIFEVIQKQGHIADDEMRRVFNMGIGMILVVPEKEAQEILERIEKLGELAYLIGVINQRENNQPPVVFV